MNAEKVTISTDDICPNTSKSHRPDWKSISIESDGGEFYVDIACADCGRSGCVGTANALTDGISW